VTIKKKIVLLGDNAVGKTSLIRRFVFNQFQDTYIATIGSKVTSKEMKISKDDDDVDITLVIWDILGRAGFTASHARIFAGAHGAILVADLTRKETLGSLERYWIPLLMEVVENVPLVFASNKSDLGSETTLHSHEMTKIASRFNIGIKDELPSDLTTTYSTSAKTGDNVEKVFMSLGYLLLSEKIPRDPIKELYENLVAEGIYRQTDKNTLIGITDAIIVDFCEGFEDEKLAMTLLRQEIIRAGLDVTKPSKEGLLKLVDYLAEVDSDLKDEEIALQNREKRLSLVKKAKE
jgi:small GTP-binding protein